MWGRDFGLMDDLGKLAVPKTGRITHLVNRDNHTQNTDRPTGNKTTDDQHGFVDGSSLKCTSDNSNNRTDLDSVLSSESISCLTGHESTNYFWLAKFRQRGVCDVQKAPPAKTETMAPVMEEGTRTMGSPAARPRLSWLKYRWNCS